MATISVLKKVYWLKYIKHRRYREKVKDVDKVFRIYTLESSTPGILESLCQFSVKMKEAYLIRYFNRYYKE